MRQVPPSPCLNLSPSGQNPLTTGQPAHSSRGCCLKVASASVLTPLYDALCTAIYSTLTEKMAMKIGSKYKFTEVQARHWEQFATDCALSPAQVKRRILQIARRLPDLARATRATFELEGNSHPVIGLIVSLIAQRCALTIRHLTAAQVDELAPVRVV